MRCVARLTPVGVALLPAMVLLLHGCDAASEDEAPSGDDRVVAGAMSIEAAHSGVVLRLVEGARSDSFPVRITAPARCSSEPTGLEATASVRRGRRVEIERPGLLEWWREAGAGLEQGFDVALRPPGAGRGLCLTVRFEGLRFRSTPGAGDGLLWNDGGAVLRYGAPVAWDSTGVELQARLVEVAGAIRIEVEDAGAVYPVTVDPLVTVATWSTSGGAEDTRFGSDLEIVGDVDGDGFDDALIGAWMTGNRSGAAYLFLGSASGLQSTYAWSAGGETYQAYYGNSVAGAGDLNGDGLADFVVTAIRNSSQRGKTYVYFGNASAAWAGADWTHSGTALDQRVGTSAAGAGDVNNDGYDDLLVAADEIDVSPYNQAGQVYLFLGSASGPGSSPTWTSSGSQDNEYHGTSVASAGDINEDGFGDVIIGAEGYDGADTDTGRARLYRGTSTGLQTSPSWTGQGPAEWRHEYGSVVLGLGDVNGDGHDDVGISGETGAHDPDRVWVYYGNGSNLPSSASWTKDGLQYDDFGSSLGMGDPNGDGVADLVVGARSDDVSTSNGGRADVFLGGPGGLPSTADWTAYAPANSLLGSAAWMTGDVDGDGQDDLLVGAPLWDGTFTDEGAAFLYPAISIDTDGDGDPDISDCDDSDASVYVGAPESCDWIDSDCDASLVDEFVDTDGDDLPDCVDDDDDDDGDPDATDCADTDPAIHAGASESCDDVDDDCDGDLVETFADEDGDGMPDCADDDIDGDGDPNASDCDDFDPAVHAAAVESCDDVDSDCDLSLVDEFDDTDGDLDPDCTDPDDDGDGDPDSSDCDPTDPAVYTGAPEACDAIDSDCDLDLVDGFDDLDGDLDPDCTDPDDDGDGDPDVTDCAPLDPAIHAGAAEACDDVDSDCDLSLVDEFADTDGDLDPDCTDPDDDGDGEADGLDCGPLDPAVYTGAPEVCDAIDSNCDGSLVDGFANTDGDTEPDCVDEDDDGDGDPDVSDCAPLDAAMYAGATEFCDLTDSDCDGDLVDEFDDTDGDLDPDCTDPDDDGDGILDVDEGSGDVDGDGIPDSLDLDDHDGPLADPDGDGFSNEQEAEAGTDPDLADTDGDGDGDASDCSPLDPTVFDGAAEVCDTIDSDCDGSLVDEFDDTDGDGTPDCVEEDTDGDGDPDYSDCAPSDPDVFTGAEEIPDDDIDQDCSGADAVTCWEDVDGDGFGGLDEVLEADGDCDEDELSDSDEDCDDDDPASYPEAAELCDGVDNDCDGAVDEELEYLDWYLDADGDGFGDPDQPFEGNPSCEATGGHVADASDCDDADAEVHPGVAEVCDGVDGDCDPSTDLDGGDADADGDGLLGCDGDCDDGDPEAYPGAPEDCSDPFDQDCDGTEATGGDPECAGGACQDCSGSMTSGSEAGWLAGLLGLVLVVPWWRRREAVQKA